MELLSINAHTNTGGVNENVVKTAIKKFQKVYNPPPEKGDLLKERCDKLLNLSYKGPINKIQRSRDVKIVLILIVAAKCSLVNKS